MIRQGFLRGSMNGVRLLGAVTIRIGFVIYHRGLNN